VITAVDRATRCIVGWDVVTERTTEIMQTMLDRSVQAARYFSDEFSTYHTLVYDPGQHRALANKSETYSVEGDNAELRHYLARLVRASRCFSRSLQALWQAVKLFVFAWNGRQLFKQAYPQYAPALSQFVSVRV
jgi:IS1 family transposase